MIPKCANCDLAADFEIVTPFANNIFLCVAECPQIYIQNGFAVPIATAPDVFPDPGTTTTKKK